MPARLRADDGLAVVGNPRPRSRTATRARQVTERLVAALDVPGTPAVLDLALESERLGAPLGTNVESRWAAPLERLLTARLVVVATPVWKGSYTGLLKAFLDQVDAGALRGRVAVPVVTVGSPAHTLAAEVHLRPLLVELGASVPTASLVVPAARLADVDDDVAVWAYDAVPLLQNAFRTAPADALTGGPV